MNKALFSFTKYLLTCIASLLLISCAASEDVGANKAEAVAMVKKAVSFIQDNGPAKAYREFNSQEGQFTDRDLYIVVYEINGIVLAHGANPKMIGKDLINLTDVDGKAFVIERLALARNHQQFWHEYKFRNPESKKIEHKLMYCERLDQTIVCGGIYVEPGTTSD
ncbi:cache domain-containing protein [Undibacterium sp. LX40W]|uniref:Cache domain-containing protein n=1 Tax=Undibacterium nitidum TaxID=2762298 RepID=A0A923HNR7_9BURK|nr:MULTISPECIES: cache domain-containing protein [Undibacterium]MBC3882432.1 cache domain-containing protein [Undibacterium nitidum]MBC3892713.1 cache domain-containing protein [Undibacterium sp. LX40W]